MWLEMFFSLVVFTNSSTRVYDRTCKQAAWRAVGSYVSRLFSRPGCPGRPKVCLLSSASGVRALRRSGVQCVTTKTENETTSLDVLFSVTHDLASKSAKSRSGPPCPSGPSDRAHTSELANALAQNMESILIQRHPTSSQLTWNSRASPLTRPPVSRPATVSWHRSLCSNSAYFRSLSPRPLTKATPSERAAPGFAIAVLGSVGARWPGPRWHVRPWQQQPHSYRAVWCSIAQWPEPLCTPWPGFPLALLPVSAVCLSGGMLHNASRHVQHGTLAPRICDVQGEVGISPKPEFERVAVPPCTPTLWEENGTTELETSPECDLR